MHPPDEATKPPVGGVSGLLAGWLAGWIPGWLGWWGWWRWCVGEPAAPVLLVSSFGVLAFWPIGQLPPYALSVHWPFVTICLLGFWALGPVGSWPSGHDGISPPHPSCAATPAHARLCIIVPTRCSTCQCVCEDNASCASLKWYGPPTQIFKMRSPTGFSTPNAFHLNAKKGKNVISWCAWNSHPPPPPRPKKKNKKN
jgi:hypothetical protein